MIEAAHNLLETVRQSVRTELAPLTPSIDREGLYPDAFMGALGRVGGYAAAIEPSDGGLGLDLSWQIAVTSLVAEECGSTAFLVWCQSTCAWYLSHTSNTALRSRYLEAVASGTLRAGTGMSNPVKHLAGIEKIRLTAYRTADGYRISGSLPWVSNAGQGHLLIVAAQVPDEGYVMLAIDADTAGLTLHPCPEFSALEGTRTLNVRFDQVNIPHSDVLAEPGQFKDFIQRIKPGFILGQTGMGLGLIKASLKTIRESNVSHSHVNVFLDDTIEELTHEHEMLNDTVRALALDAQVGHASLLPVLEARLKTSELALRATQSAMLHAGAKAYLMRHPAQRRLREAMFVAIVTPALKHLRKEIHDLQQAATHRETAITGVSV